ncbi:Ribosomal protein lysine methyltransferase [Sporothrix stenoceras]|uniref:Ribosomal protein lysine methyltransferase n=1 Tax=Sporothrix stenoceras TaxID=5173 RepID=A0ABR3ZKZ0_9PEZI
MTSLTRLLARLGSEVDDPDEETFLLLAHERPSAQNLGFLDSHAAVLDLTVAGRDLTIHQSPAVLNSNRSGGTTGAVLWKITPVVAEWLARPENMLFGDADGGLLGRESAVLELGCGIAGVIGLALTGKGTKAAGHSSAPRKKAGRSKRPGRDTLSPSPSSTSSNSWASFSTANTVGRYILTDQPYVHKFLQRNLEENGAHEGSSPLLFEPLDWETDEVTPAGRLGGVSSFDAVLACDCIYNEALVAPLVQTCVDVCKLREAENESGRDNNNRNQKPPTVVVVAQQLRDPDVLTTWLTAFAASFRVWRVPESLLTPALLPTAGFAVHIGILKNE